MPFGPLPNGLSLTHSMAAEINGARMNSRGWRGRGVTAVDSSVIMTEAGVE